MGGPDLTVDFTDRFNDAVAEFYDDPEVNRLIDALKAKMAKVVENHLDYDHDEHAWQGIQEHLMNDTGVDDLSVFDLWFVQGEY